MSETSWLLIVCSAVLFAIGYRVLQLSRRSKDLDESAELEPNILLTRIPILYVHPPARIRPQMDDELTIPWRLKAHGFEVIEGFENETGQISIPGHEHLTAEKVHLITPAFQRTENTFDFAEENAQAQVSGAQIAKIEQRRTLNYPVTFEAALETAVSLAEFDFQCWHRDNDNKKAPTESNRI